MTITPEPDRRRTHDMVHRGKRFLEHARIDQRRANILIQLAESVGDRIDSLSGYFDMLLAQPDHVPASEHEKYFGWFAELGTLESSL